MLLLRVYMRYALMHAVIPPIDLSSPTSLMSLPTSLVLKAYRRRRLGKLLLGLLMRTTALLLCRYASGICCSVSAAQNLLAQISILPNLGNNTHSLPCFDWSVCTFGSWPLSKTCFLLLSSPPTSCFLSGFEAGLDATID